MVNAVRRDLVLAMVLAPAQLTSWVEVERYKSNLNQPQPLVVRQTVSYSGQCRLDLLNLVRTNIKICSTALNLNDGRSLRRGLITSVPLAMAPK